MAKNLNHKPQSAMEWIEAQLEFVETINALDDLLNFIDRSSISLHDVKQRWRTIARSLGEPDGEQRMDDWKARYHKARNEALSVTNKQEREAKDADITDQFREELVEIMQSIGRPGSIEFAVRQVQSRPHPSDIIYRSTLVSLVSTFEGLIGAMYRVLLKGKPELYISNSQAFSLGEIARLGSVDAIMEEAVERKADASLRGGLEDWATELSKSDINIKECCIDWKKTLEIFQRRNAHVHTRGRVNSAYKSKVSCDLEVGDALDIDISYLRNAIPQILSLGCLVALRTWLAINPKDAMLVGGVPYMYYDELLERGNWEAVEKISSVAKNLDAPLDLRFGQRTYYWIARKMGRGKQSISKEVTQWDTSALKPLFVFERHILLGELDEAERLLEAAKRSGSAWAHPPLDTPVVQFDKDAADRLNPIIFRDPDSTA